jgi:hypothetical protein
MAIVVLVLWLFTAGAGFYLLVTSNLARARPAAVAPTPEPAAAAPATQTAPATPASPAPPASRRRAARDPFAPPSLVAARNAPMVPGLRSLLEFAHPASGLIGFAFWLGYTFVHYRALGWIALGLVAVTACLGLTWFAANTRAARRQHQDERQQDERQQDERQQDERQQDERQQDEPGPSFSGRLMALHGGAAAVTITLAALTALVLGR